MQCFTHPTEAAIGTCKSCGKGVCRGCAIEVDRGLACSKQCEPVAAGLSRWEQAAIRNVGFSAAQRIMTPVMAVLFICSGIIYSRAYGPGPLVWVSYAGGAAFALITVVSWIRSRTS
jgi:hypothetical protein